MGPKGLNWSTALEDFCFLFKFPGCAVRAQSKSKGESAQNHQNPAPNSGESCQNHPESRNREICEIPKFQKNVYSRGESLLLPCPIRCELTAERSLCCVRDRRGLKTQVSNFEMMLGRRQSTKRRNRPGERSYRRRQGKRRLCGSCPIEIERRISAESPESCT